MTRSRVGAALLWAVAGLGLFLAVLSAAMAYGSYHYGRYLEQYGVPTTASVVGDVDVLSRYATVEFVTPRGYVYVTQVRSWMLDPPRETADVDIVYDPSDPRDAMLAGSAENRVLAALFAFGAAYATAVAAGSAVGALLLRRR
ncbi:MAG: hypothetical protein SW019_23560 [Actinomycetota bacterium]|nr:hypothetical protein [Actinomycetota bacterium]